MKKIITSNLTFILLVIFLCIPVVLPFFKEGYFPTHDGEWAVVRLGDMFRTVRDFQLPPRFSGSLNFGYGYPLFNFAYPFPYYLGLVLYMPMQSFVLSIKTIFVGSVFLSGIFMYLASSYLWKNKFGAFVSAIIYIYLPYRMIDLYVRGSIGESISFVLFPLILYFSLKLFDSAFSRISVVVLSLLIGILVMTHNIMTILYMPILLTFVTLKILNEKRMDVLRSFFLCIGLGAGVSFFFWFPALLEKGNVLLSQTPIADRSLYFVNIQQLIVPDWGYGPPTESDGFSYQLGIAQLGVVIIAIIIVAISLLKNKITQTPAKRYAIILSFLYILCFIMLFPFTGIIWKSVPLISEINYPWTFLSQLGFITALLAGFVVIQGKLWKYFAFGLSIVAIVLTLPYAKPISYSKISDQQYLTNEATTTSSSELMPLWVSEHPKERYQDKVEVVDGSATISNLTFNSKFLSFKYDAATDPTFKINTIYYPGWNAYLNNEKVDIAYENPQGVMYIKGSQYRDTVSLYFSETVPRYIANIVSVLAMLVIAFIILRPILLFKHE